MPLWWTTCSKQKRAKGTLRGGAAQGRNTIGVLVLVAGEFCRKLTELFGTLLLTLCFLLFGFAPLRFFLETLAQYFGGPGTMRLTDFFRRIAVEMMPEVCVHHSLLIAGRVGVQAQGNPERLSVQLWKRRQNLFVYADRQRQVIAKDRKLLAKLLE